MCRFSGFATCKSKLRCAAKAIARPFAFFNAETGGTAGMKLEGLLFSIDCSIAARYFFHLAMKRSALRFFQNYSKAS